MAVSQFTDEELARRAANGDEGAFAELVERYLRPVFSFIYRYTGSADAEDLAQDTFVRAWRAIESFDVKKKLKTWIFAIAKNAALDWIKRKRPHAFSDFDTEEGGNVIAETFADPDFDPDGLIRKIDAASALGIALQEVSPEDRALITLRARDELSFEEIAEIFGKPVNTIKSRYRRALAKIRAGGGVHPND